MTTPEQFTHPLVVDLYCRISTDPQEENTSLDEQERAGREYCREHSLIISMVHRETFSGYQYRERKILSEMRDRYRDGKIQGVVIRTLDRLSRSQTHVAILMEEMEHYGITLHSVKEVIDDTPMGKFARMVLAFVAEMEREKIMDRTMTGRTNAAQNGKIVSGSKPIFGVTWHDAVAKDYLILDEQPTAILQRAAEEYANGDSLHLIVRRFEAEGIAPPKGERWHVRTLRRLLTDPRMTGQNVHIFTYKDKRAKQHLDTVLLPEGTYPRIISDELYKKVIDRAETNAALSIRNSKHPERFLLRSGFARCLYCSYVMTTRTIANSQGTEYNFYVCANDHSACKHYRVPSTPVDAEVWSVVSLLADHVQLLEESIELAMQHGSLDDDLRATEATLTEWKAKVANFEDDLNDSSLRGDTRNGIRNLLNSAYGMVEELELQRAELVNFSVDREHQREEYEKVLAWCRKVKTEREELTIHQKRDFLSLLGAVVILEKREHKGDPVEWDMKVRLPAVEAIIYKGRLGEIAGPVP